MLSTLTRIHRAWRSRSRPRSDGPVTRGRRVFDSESRHRASPEEIFPLLCPVREYDWIDGWRCRMVYSDSGFAEEDGVFTTDLEGHSTWVITAYEPPRRIEFCIVSDRGVAARLKIRLESIAEGSTRVLWRRLYTGLGTRGRAEVAGLDTTVVCGKMEDLAARLDHYLQEGEALRRPRFRH